ncbi:cation:proton antiporter [Oceanobacter mangrovi]|uniref:cation:proton antiporter n=1 Tax=Oceanobacter mangrovi TaxID=2862510 RepID=UPI001C8DABF3|nr:cation:proton antiporter [Oceanobacter mangrovi]
MPDSSLIFALSLALLFYGLLARRIDAAGVSAPMLMTLAGILVSPLGLNLVDANIQAEGLKLLAELTLALILFTDASQVNRHQLLRFGILPIRLLAIGLPLTMLLGWLLAVPLLGLSWLAAAWLAIMLAPTDAALAQSIFSDQRINLKLRHSITVESGLNDGLALPVLLFVLALMSAGDYAWLDHKQWPLFMLQQFAFGTLVGIGCGRWGGELVQWATDHKQTEPLYQRLSSWSLAMLAYSAAEMIGGNGFIAAFMAGLFLEAQRKIVIQRLREFGEAEGALLSLLVFFLFGLVFVHEAWPLFSWPQLGYALLSLTLIRMLPVLISLLGSGLPFGSKIFLAWFGPRGIASILYLLMAIQAMGHADRIPAYDTVFGTTVLTVLLSILLHGLSTHVWQRWPK